MAARKTKTAAATRRRRRTTRRKTPVAPVPRVKVSLMQFAAVDAKTVSEDLDGMFYRVGDGQIVYAATCGDRYNFDIARLRALCDALEDGGLGPTDEQMETLKESLRGY